MKHVQKKIVALFTILSLLLPVTVFARQGDSGYEGGISSGEVLGKTTYEYQEVCFVTGQPVLFKGTLMIKKSLKNELVNTVYTYYLKNVDKDATLNRVVTYSTKLTEKSNGQVVEETSFTKTPTETVKVGDVTYILRNYDFTRSAIIDSKPAVNYYAGNTWGKKTYQIGGRTDGGTVTVEATGEFYGYDQYWGNTEVQTINYLIEGEQRKGDIIDRWGGTASVSLSSSITKQLKYVANEPDQISFDGGYVQVQYNNSILEYACQLPEFDASGISTDNLISTADSLQLETFPVQTRLPVANLTHLRGHWAENDINVLYSLEVFKGNDTIFNPEQLITRAQFMALIVEAAKEVPLDPALVKKTPTRSSSRGKSKEVVISPFVDVSTEHLYFPQIQSAFNRGMVQGGGNGTFNPNGTVTLADALTVFVTALGLDSLAPNPNAVTTFRDNDQIPAYARSSVYVAQKIGLIQPDAWGYLNPNKKLEMADAALLLNKFIMYMRDGIKKDYRERIVNYI